MWEGTSPTEILLKITQISFLKRTLNLEFPGLKCPSSAMIPRGAKISALMAPDKKHRSLGVLSTPAFNSSHSKVISELQTLEALVLFLLHRDSGSPASFEQWSSGGW